MANPKTWALDPDHTMARRFTCGHVSTACCEEHLGAVCDLCDPLPDLAAAWSSAEHIVDPWTEGP